MNDKTYCPRAVMEGRGGPNVPFKPPFNGEMTWREDNTCSWCGSLHQDEFMRRLEAGDIEVGPTDKSYKVYVRNVGGENFKQTSRNCPVHPCPDVTDTQGNVNVENCTHWVTREVDGTKFYFHHLTDAQRARFIELHNAGKIKLGYPHYFYVTPFFCAPASKSGATT